MSHDIKVEENQSSAVLDLPTPSQKKIKYTIKGTDQQSIDARTQLQNALKVLSDEATFFRDSIKNSKTTTKKQYYTKKLTKATRDILKLLNRVQPLL